MELIINTFGTSLNCEKGCFVVSNLNGKQKIPAEGVSCIILCKGTQITSDAIMMAIENEIDVLFSDKKGKPLGRVWSPKYGSISTIRKGQVNFLHSKDSVEWIKSIIIKKIENQQALISMISCMQDEGLQRSNKPIARLEEYIEKISSLQAENVFEISATLRGWEGVASKIYFETINSLTPDKYKFDGRSQHPAMDIFNALLNYGYGILYGKIEGALIRAGIDPYIGILHRDEYNRPVLVYDIIEIYRIWIDYIVFNIIRQDIITEDFYSIREDGSYWLENLGRRILIQSMNDYLDEHIKVKGLERSRSTHIQLFAQDLAQTFKKHQKI